MVYLLKNGTKIRYTDYQDYEPEFPESIDLKITNYCDLNCPMCHEKSSTSGNHANLQESFLKKLHSGTELAIGGGNPLSHPYLLNFLNDMKKQNVICNLTVNQKHLIENIEYIQSLIDNNLIYGLGVSLFTYDEKVIEFAQKNHNVVFHIICGVIDENLLKQLYNKNLKLLFLGYKKYGRGQNYFNESIQNKIDSLENDIEELAKNFSVVSFDNLALKQLKIKEKVSQLVWDSNFMGTDGQFTMYVDLVEKKFSKSSTSNKRFDLLNNIEEMFKSII